MLSIVPAHLDVHALDRVVRAAVICDHRLLLVRRCAADDFAGVWELPGGATDGQPYRHALRRELAEETGLELVALLGLVHEQFFASPAGPGFVERTYETHATGQVQLDGREHDTYRWHPLGEPFCADALSPSCLRVLDRLAACPG